MSETTQSNQQATAAPATPGTESSPAPVSANPDSTSAGDTDPVTKPDAPAEKSEAKSEVKHADEGVLGYKSPGLIHSLLFSKRFFWFSDEPLALDTLDSYLRVEKADQAHANAAWATQTGKGLLFFAKRAEDKPTPAGIINLSEISDVGKDGPNEFVFKLHGHKHAFQTSSPGERDHWWSAMEKKAAEAKSLKDGIVATDGYQKNLDQFEKMGVSAAGTAASRSLSKSKERSKSTDAKTKESDKKEKSDTSSSSDEEKEKPAKSRSHSRKRTSIFGLLGKKDDTDDNKKDAVKEDKIDETPAPKNDGEAVKSGDEAAKDVGREKSAADGADKGPATAGTAAAPVAESSSSAPVQDEGKTDASAAKAPEGTEKKSGKRNSIFGISLFGGKKDATSPSAEKSPTEGAPVASNGDVPPVSETAPKIEQPVQSKPIDTQAVTAPVDSSAEAHDAAGATPDEPAATTPTKGVTSPSAHKSNIMSFFKRQDSKVDAKKEEKADDAAAVSPTAEPSAATETPAAESGPEDKPALDKKGRRASFFNNFGALKEKKSPEATSDSEGGKGEGKKSPLPQKLGDLFRKPSKATSAGTKPSESGEAGSDGAKTEAGPAPAETVPAAESSAAPPASTDDTATATPAPAPEVKASA